MITNEPAEPSEVEATLGTLVTGNEWRWLELALSAISAGALIVIAVALVVIAA